jgi:hypothetical protein
MVMIPSERLKAVDALESFRLMLEKAETTPVISQAIEKHGYTAEKLKEGRELLKVTREIYENDIKEKDKFAIISAGLLRKMKEIDQMYRIHRKKAKMIARDDPEMSTGLSINGPYPRLRIVWLVSVRKFYSEAAINSKYQEKLLRLNMTRGDFETGLAHVKELDDLLAKRTLHKGLSEQSTVDKKKALNELYIWKKDFYTIAKIALRDNPELLESLY